MEGEGDFVGAAGGEIILVDTLLLEVDLGDIIRGDTIGGVMTILLLLGGVFGETILLIQGEGDFGDSILLLPGDSTEEWGVRLLLFLLFLQRGK